jgi:hypothetical protein
MIHFYAQHNGIPYCLSLTFALGLTLTTGAILTLSNTVCDGHNKASDRRLAFTHRSNTVCDGHNKASDHTLARLISRTDWTFVAHPQFSWFTPIPLSVEAKRETSKLALWLPTIIARERYSKTSAARVANPGGRVPADGTCNAGTEPR